MPFQKEALHNEDNFRDFARESDRFHDALAELTDEVYHVLLGDVAFLQKFNLLCADYIEISGFGNEFKTRRGTLKRVAIPVWARSAIFYRDKGEYRACKRRLAALINCFETERYDHIVPLVRFGVNDVTNNQQLFEPYYLKKSAKEEPVSQLYQRAIPS